MSSGEERQVTFAVTMKVRIWTNIARDLASDQAIQNQAMQVANRWSDGRYDFDSEMARYGAVALLSRAIHRAVEETFYAKHGNAITQEGGQSFVTAQLESSKVFKTARMDMITDENITVTIIEREERP